MNGQTIGEVLDRADRAIRESKEARVYPEDARAQAEELLAHALGRRIEADELSSSISVRQRQCFEALVERRVGGEPTALIVGQLDFMGMWLAVREGVFLPRKTSYRVVEMAVER